MHWLLEPTALELMLRARRECVDVAAALSWEEQQSTASSDRPRNLTVAGSTAQIAIEGVLTKKPDFFALFFGGGNTTYSTIRQALATAEMDPTIKDVVLHIDSPGGSVDGLFETLDAIHTFREASSKKLRVRAENAQSAAYGIAAAAGSIEAVTRGATFGSIGTAVSYLVRDDVVTLTNSESPNKRPDVRTDEGKAVVVQYLDQVNAEFVAAIARGRGVSSNDVIEGYGRGASFTATEAKRLGLIDRIASTAPRAVPNNKGKAMSEELDRAVEAAVQRGIQQERDRVFAHLTMGESCGDMSIALEAIRSGAGMGLELNARYLSAGMNRADRQRRQQETSATEAALSGVETGATPGAVDLGDQVVAVLTGDKSFVRAAKKGAA